MQILDGSTRDALLRKVGLLRGQTETVLAGRMMGLLNALSRLPVQLWYEEDSSAHDLRFMERVLEHLRKGVRLLMDMGFTDYGLYGKLCERGVFFITRLRSNARWQVAQVLQRGHGVSDALIRLGHNGDSCAQTLRVVQVVWHGRQLRYLTNVLDPGVLPIDHVVSLYSHRWCIEEALLSVERLLGLAYFVTGSIDGAQTQLWAT